MTLQQIRYILGVAEAGSLNKASEKLFSEIGRLAKQTFQLAISNFQVAIGAKRLSLVMFKSVRSRI